MPWNWTHQQLLRLCQAACQPSHTNKATTCPQDQTATSTLLVTLPVGTKHLRKPYITSILLVVVPVGEVKLLLEHYALLGSQLCSHSQDQQRQQGWVKESFALPKGGKGPQQCCQTGGLPKVLQGLKRPLGLQASAIGTASVQAINGALMFWDR